MRRVALALTGAVLVVTIFAVGRRREASPTPAPARPVAVARATPSAMPPIISAGSAGAAHAPAAPEALPGSLDGTEADGAITADAAGHLVISLELRRLFDHFLAATGEEPLATIRARIIAVLHERLPATAASEAIEILDRYLAYREAARTLAPAASDVDGLTQVHALRAKLFTPAVVQAFFADEEAATFAALAARDVLADPALSDAERARRVAELEAKLPAQVRADRAAAVAPIEEMSREAALRAAGASQAQITASRTAAFGADGAARLAELDRAHAAWDARLAQFRAARAALLADSRLDDAARQAQVEALLARSFTPTERLRVQAIEGIPARP
jgi:lipase chaperone LimK